MAKIFFLFVILLILVAAVKTFPVTVENSQENDSREIKDPSKHVEDYPENFIQTLRKSRRNKRSIIVGGVCPQGQVWKPRPFFCITCEDYEELSGNPC